MLINFQWMIFKEREVVKWKLINPRPPPQNQFKCERVYPRNHTSQRYLQVHNFSKCSVSNLVFIPFRFIYLDRFPPHLCKPKRKAGSWDLCIPAEGIQGWPLTFQYHHCGPKALKSALKIEQGMIMTRQ